MQPENILAAKWRINCSTYCTPSGVLSLIIMNMMMGQEKREDTEVTKGKGRETGGKGRRELEGNERRGREGRERRAGEGRESRKWNARNE